MERKTFSFEKHPSTMNLAELKDYSKTNKISYIGCNKSELKERAIKYWNENPTRFETTLLNTQNILSLSDEDIFKRFNRTRDVLINELKSLSPEIYNHMFNN